MHIFALTVSVLVPVAGNARFVLTSAHQMSINGIPWGKQQICLVPLHLLLKNGKNKKRAQH